jgi:hypothetical protein
MPGRSADCTLQLLSSHATSPESVSAYGDIGTPMPSPIIVTLPRPDIANLYAGIRGILAVLDPDTASLTAGVQQQLVLACQELVSLLYVCSSGTGPSTVDNLQTST